MHNKYFSFAPALILSIVLASSATSVFAMDVTTNDDLDITMVLQPIKSHYVSKPSKAEIKEEFDNQREAMKKANDSVNKELKLGRYARTPHIQK